MPDWIPLLRNSSRWLAVIVVFLAVGSLVGIGWQMLHGYPHLRAGPVPGDAGDWICSVSCCSACWRCSCRCCRTTSSSATACCWPIMRLPTSASPAALGPIPVQLRQRAGHAVFGHERLRPFPGKAACGSTSTGLASPSCCWCWPRCSGCAAPSRAGASACARRGAFCTSARVLLVLALAGFAAIGVFLFYNTNVLNHYQSTTRARASRPTTKSSTASTRICRSRASPR